MTTQLPMTEDQPYEGLPLAEFQAALHSEYCKGAPLDELAARYGLTRTETLEHITLHSKQIHSISQSVELDDAN